MPRTPDRRDGPLFEEGIYMESTQVAVSPGELRYVEGRWSLVDQGGEFDPRSGGGLSEESHRTLAQLTHWIDASSFDEIARVGGKVSSLTVWDSVERNRKVREEIVTRVGGKVSQLVTLQYDASGQLKESLTETFVRVSGRVSTITRTRT